jgi:hypothetical protein
MRSRKALVVAVLGLALALTCSWPASGPVPRPNLLLVSIDTLRADHVGFLGYPRGTTPFLDSLAARGQVLTNALVPLPATGPSHASLLTGLHPLEHTVLSNSMTLPDGVETLAEVLREHGYFTMGAVAVSHLGSHYGFGQGFDVLSDKWDPSPPNTVARRTADALNEDVFRLLDAYVRQRGSQPLFLFVHYFDVHSPYSRHPDFAMAEPIPLPDGVGRGRRKLAKVIDSYDQGVRFVDAHLEQLHRRLEGLGLARDLLTAVVSDHGEQLGEHGHAGGHADIYRETVRIPVVMEGKGVAPGRVEVPVSSMDVPVTLLARLGLGFRGSGPGRPIPDPGVPPRAGPRSLLVVGYPSYTRSMAVVREGSWFIRNLDYAYRRAALARPPPGPPSSGFVEARIGPAEDGRALYPLAWSWPPERMVPVRVTVDVRLARPECAGTAAIGLEPRISYLKEPLPFRGALRLILPATSGDRLTVIVRPAECTGTVFYEVKEEAEAVPPSTAEEVVETGIWQELLAARKVKPGDELYLVGDDPQMRRNLLVEGGLDAFGLGGDVHTLWSNHARRGPAPVDANRGLSPEELEALKSLGYVR